MIYQTTSEDTTPTMTINRVLVLLVSLLLTTPLTMIGQIIVYGSFYCGHASTGCSYAAYSTIWNYTMTANASCTTGTPSTTPISAIMTYRGSCQSYWDLDGREVYATGSSVADPGEILAEATGHGVNTQTNIYEYDYLSDNVDCLGYRFTTPPFNAPC